MDKHFVFWPLYATPLAFGWGMIPVYQEALSPSMSLEKCTAHTMALEINSSFLLYGSLSGTQQVPSAKSSARSPLVNSLTTLDEDRSSPLLSSFHSLHHSHQFSLPTCRYFCLQVALRIFGRILNSHTSFIREGERSHSASLLSQLPHQRHNGP